MLEESYSESTIQQNPGYSFTSRSLEECLLQAWVRCLTKEIRRASKSANFATLAQNLNLACSKASTIKVIRNQNIDVSYSQVLFSSLGLILLEQGAIVQNQLM